LRLTLSLGIVPESMVEIAMEPCVAAENTPDHLLVEVDSPSTASLHSGSEGSLNDSQVLVQVVRFVFTANTLTYAVAGKMPVLNYFGNFPAPTSGYARPVCWGCGVVVASRCDVPVGTRIYGLLAMSKFVTLTPEVAASGTQFVDVAPHRENILLPYKTYFTSSDDLYRDLSIEEEDFQLAAGNLFSTGWSMSQEAATHPAAPSAVLITSASSRTAFAAAFAAHFHKLALKVIGLTSAGNLDFTRNLGVYDEVLSYEDIPSLHVQKIAVYDLSGNDHVKQGIYKHFRDMVVTFGQVGMTHIESQRVQLETFGGARPSSFLVFEAMQALKKPFGGGRKLSAALADATNAYKARVFPSFQAEREYGADETLAIFRRMARNEASPGITYVCSLWPKGQEEPNVPASRI